MRRRDDGPEVYQQLLDQLASEGVADGSRQTIAGILAISLEPSQAIRRWQECRAALGALGLQGAYADVAAAFGASDDRGARVFALAYAAQRQSLARSTIDDADRFAPELAHEGVRGQTDRATGERIPTGLYSFDPYTLLFYHWIITNGHSGSYGWEPIYRDPVVVRRPPVVVGRRRLRWLGRWRRLQRERRRRLVVGWVVVGGRLVRRLRRRRRLQRRRRRRERLVAP